jgi:hypothetical protein
VILETELEGMSGAIRSHAAFAAGSGWPGIAHLAAFGVDWDHYPDATRAQAIVKSLANRPVNDDLVRAIVDTREQARTPEEQTEDEPLMPEHICENEAERHEWRVTVLEFIRDRIESAEVYRLGEADLRFGELLPEKPAWLEQEEYEERTSVGFHPERLSKKLEKYCRENC